jgi:hypothetical protein
VRIKWNAGCAAQCDGDLSAVRKRCASVWRSAIAIFGSFAKILLNALRPMSITVTSSSSASTVAERGASSRSASFAERVACAESCGALARRLDEHRAVEDDEERISRFSSADDGAIAEKAPALRCLGDLIEVALGDARE